MSTLRLALVALPLLAACSASLPQREDAPGKDLPPPTLTDSAAATPLPQDPTPQDRAPRDPGLQDPDSWCEDPAAVVDGYLTRAGIEPIDVLLAGTFHFDDQGLDAWKPTHSFDALAENRQRQIEALVTDLAAYAPDVICVERWPSTRDDLDAWYAAWRRGERAEDRNEIAQIAFRLADRLDLPRVHGIDAPGAWLEPRVDPLAWAKQNGRLRQLATPLQKVQREALVAGDRFIDRADLRDILRFKNHPAALAVSHASYLVGPFHAADGQEYPGPDGFISHWFNRNLRIFANLRRAAKPGQRVLVLFGAGHVPILKHCVESSPEFSLTAFDSVVKRPK